MTPCRRPPRAVRAACRPHPAGVEPERPRHPAAGTPERGAATGVDRHHRTGAPADDRVRGRPARRTGDATPALRRRPRRPTRCRAARPAIAPARRRTTSRSSRPRTSTRTARSTSATCSGRSPSTAPRCRARTAAIPQGPWVVDLTLKDSGLERVQRLCRVVATTRTSTCPGGTTAIVLDGNTESNPAPQTPTFTSDQVEISGSFTNKTASDLALVLQLRRAAHRAAAAAGRDGVGDPRT